MSDCLYNYGHTLLEDYDLLDKDRCRCTYIADMLNRTQTMFQYDGLPDTITQRDLELLVQTRGYGVAIMYNDNLYVINGNMGGKPSPNNMPTSCIVANASLNISNEYTIDTDCVVIPNDSMYVGLLPIISRYATQIVENDISMWLCDVNSRIVSLISASDDRTKKSAELYLQGILQGKQGIIGETAMLDALKTQPYAHNGNSQLTDLIEYHQYIKASLYNDLGLNSNYNMKRESINSGESQLNNDALFPLVDDMLSCRQKAVDKINSLWGLSITVSKASAWKDNEIEVTDAQEDLSERSDSDTGGDDVEKTE